MTAQLPASSCPICNFPLSTRMNAALQAQPAADDLVVCIGCGSFLRLTEELHLARLQPGQAMRMRLERPAVFQELAEAQQEVRRRMAGA